MAAPRPPSANTVGRPRRSSARVEHVVVHERRHVQQLHGHPARHEPLVGPRCGQEHEHRPEPLAARGERAAGVTAERAPWPSATSASRSSVRASRSASSGPPAASTEPSCACAVFTASVPAWMAMIPPAVRIQRTSVEARRRHARGQLLGSREAPHAAGQVRVCVRVPRDPAELRHDMVEPRPEEPRQRRLRRRRDLEHHDAAARLRDAHHLAQAAIEVREVARAEADGHGVERVVGIGEVERVALLEAQPGRLPPRDLEHRRREVGARHLGAPARQRDREVARPGGHVERGRPRAHARELGGALAPAVVHPRRHDRVHPVVDPRDAVEHGPDLRVGERPRRCCRH